MRMFIVASLILAMSAVTFAKDDPFTGMWREIPSKPEVANRPQRKILSKPGVPNTKQWGGPRPKIPSKPEITNTRQWGTYPASELTIMPINDGLSFQGINITYGKEIYTGDGFYAKFVRVDSHKLKMEDKQRGGQLGTKSVFTVSPDGQYLYLNMEERSGNMKNTAEFRRIGSIETEDAFFGTWRQTTTCTIKVKGKSLEMYPNCGQIILSVKELKFKLNGKEYETPLRGVRTSKKTPDGKIIEIDGSVTIKATRTDDQTIEIIATPNYGRGEKILYQVKGDSLIKTQTTLPTDSPIVTEFERVK